VLILLFMDRLESLLQRIRHCRLCEAQLPKEPKPILRAHQNARLLIVGQAAGIRVHETGIPWNDPSGDRLRLWLALERDIFYDEQKIAIIPMGYCYPGTGPAGDYPPQKACAEHWLPALLACLPNIQLAFLVGKYAQAYYLGETQKANLTKTVHAFREYLPNYFPLPHPSPRNNRWLAKNPWFEQAVIPCARQYCHRVLST
jgi:uracil-DNA glycosylase